jgi:hypothetical protein
MAKRPKADNGTRWRVVVVRGAWLRLYTTKTEAMAVAATMNRATGKRVARVQKEQQ